MVILISSAEIFECPGHGCHVPFALNILPVIEQVIAAIDVMAPSIVNALLSDHLKPAFAGIDFSGMLTKMINPSVLQYLQNPTDEGWLKLDPALTEVRHVLD